MKFSQTTEGKNQDVLLDARDLPCHVKHATIFKEFDLLADGKSLLLVNDHDPIPLRRQFDAKYKDRFQWEYLEHGPDLWRIRIHKGNFSDIEKGSLDQVEHSPLNLDVRPLFERGESPCEAIDDAVASLKPQQRFILITPFEPRPLFAKLGRMGFSHQSEEMPDGSWKIEFQRDNTDTEEESAEHTSSCSSSQHIQIDARGLEPPQPLVRTLEALAQLKKGQRLSLRSDRKPMHLFEQLEERCFNYDCSEQPDHTFITEIWQSNESSNGKVRPSH